MRDKKYYFVKCHEMVKEQLNNTEDAKKWMNSYFNDLGRYTPNEMIMLERYNDVERFIKKFFK